MGSSHSSYKHDKSYGICHHDQRKQTKGYLFSCSKSSQKESSVLSRDNSSQNVNSLKMRCQYCGKLKLENDIGNHINICCFNPHNMKIECNHCKQLFSLSLYQEHLDNCNENKENVTLMCEFCNDNVKVELYLEHMEKCQIEILSSLFSCGFCKKEFSLENKKSHVATCKANPENVKIDCKYCNHKLKKTFYDQHFQECKKKYKNFLEQDNECAICLIEFKRSDNITFLACLHKYHARCISDWSRKQKVCPICRTDFP